LQISASFSLKTVVRNRTFDRNRLKSARFSCFPFDRLVAGNSATLEDLDGSGIFPVFQDNVIAVQGISIGSDPPLLASSRWTPLKCTPLARVDRFPRVVTGCHHSRSIRQIIAPTWPVFGGVIGKSDPFDDPRL
jgi:hypothetical protein